VLRQVYFSLLNPMQNKRVSSFWSYGDEKGSFDHPRSFRHVQSVGGVDAVVTASILAPQIACPAMRLIAPRTTPLSPGTG
jgi:hypothetical protein